MRKNQSGKKEIMSWGEKSEKGEREREDFPDLPLIEAR